ncbi:MAG: dockerin type I repeat-containing protein [Clostridia bacterium]|nr:dockerin type I repeat-containing protein [Clostridia bacterium]
MVKTIKISLIIFMLYAICMVIASNVYGVKYENSSNLSSVEVNGNKVTLRTTQYQGKEITIEYENVGEVIGISNSSQLIMTQKEINKYTEPRNITYTYKQRIDDNILSVAGEDDASISVIDIDGEKWLVCSGIIEYEFVDLTSSWEYVTGLNNNDVESVNFGKSITYTINGESTNNWIYVPFNLISENSANILIHAIPEYVNERNIPYIIGGYGGGSEGTFMLNPIYDVDKVSIKGGAYLPQNADLSKVYLRLLFDTYQGEKIEVEGGKGTLKYIGKIYKCYDGINISKEYHCYISKVSDLELEEKKSMLFPMILNNGYKITDYLGAGYMFDPNLEEEVVEENEENKKEEELTDEISISYYGNSKFKIVQIDKEDEIYERIEKQLVNSSEEKLYEEVFDIYRVNGNYGEKIGLTFDIDEKYKGKKYRVLHLNNDGEFEKFEGIVENGKIEINVGSLSPFGISILENSKMLGDLDSNKKIDINDAIIILKHITGKIKLDESEMIIGDVTKDSKVDIQDAILILKYIVGKIKSF